MIIVSSILLLICTYLSLRYYKLHNNLSVPGTSICSWSRYIDCDRVLLTIEARYFLFPNAYIGFIFNKFGFLIATAFEYTNIHVFLYILLVAYGVSSLVTIVFWNLLLRLPNLCPLCPLHHIFTYILFVMAVMNWVTE